MKFAKTLENEAENIPVEWRPYLIQYKKLKKVISKVADEIQDHGVSVSMLHQYLESHETEVDDSPNADSPQVEYYFTGEAPNIRPCIKFTYNASNKEVDELLSGIIGDKTKSHPKLAYQRSHDNTDFFTLTSADEDDGDDADADHEDNGNDALALGKHQNAEKNSPAAAPGSSKSELLQVPSPGSSSSSAAKRRRSSAAKVIRDLTELTLSDRDSTPAADPVPSDSPNSSDSDSIVTVRRDSASSKQMRSIVVELERDDEFFYMLMTELQGAARLQAKTYDRFEADVGELESRMLQVANPNEKSDMYIWRKIFSLYMDAQIFQGRIEADRSIHSIDKAKKQLAWFASQLQEDNLMKRLKSKASHNALKQFMALNTELITIKHYQALNQTAMTKILKKHDKRSGLTASTRFPDFVGADRFFTPKLAKMLYASILEKVTSIIPQPDDYSCPVCMNLAWRPIRLVCGHVFCVRCLIKAQKQRMAACPLCRHDTAVRQASALNLDESLQKFMLQYFPKEIKQKKRENEREQAIEDVELFTGRKFTPDQVARMTREQEKSCIIM
ncbi:SPX domain-containing protein [Gongronella butleri]|nr:SPX domain-containing protein [Gongronella butleri]